MGGPPEAQHTGAQPNQCIVCPRCPRCHRVLDRYDACEQCEPRPTDADLPAEFKGKNLDSGFDLTNASFREAHAAVGRVVNGEEWGAFLYGLYGLGKTALAWAAVVAVRENANALKRNGIEGPISWAFMYETPDLLAWLRSDFDKLEERMAMLMRSDILLALDDLGQHKETEWSGEILFRIINARYRNHSPTIVTTNVEREDLPGALIDRYRSHFWHVTGESQR
jgi:DNA replication protein DnaC